MNRRNWLATIGAIVTGRMIPFRKRSVPRTLFIPNEITLKDTVRFTAICQHTEGYVHLTGKLNEEEFAGHPPLTLYVREVCTTRRPAPLSGTPLPPPDELGFCKENPYYLFQMEGIIDKISEEEGRQLLESYTVTLTHTYELIGSPVKVVRKPFSPEEIERGRNVLGWYNTTDFEHWFPEERFPSPKEMTKRQSIRSGRVTKGY